MLLRPKMQDISYRNEYKIEKKKIWRILYDLQSCIKNLSGSVSQLMCHRNGLAGVGKVDIRRERIRS